MRPKFWVAYGALALALALLVPTLAPLSGSMDSFAQDLANGAFRPFGPQGGKAPLKAFSGSLGGFTGSSEGNYLPGSAEVPDMWVMDRDGRAGNVVIDAVFNPSLGAMKRLKAYDKLGADGITLEVEDPRFRPYTADPNVDYDLPMNSSYRVQFRAGEPTVIFSPHPRPLIITFSTSPPVAGGVSFLFDGADTLYALAKVDATVTLNITFRSERAYYEIDVPSMPIESAYPINVRPTVPAQIADDARVVLARAGADGEDLAQTLNALTAYFRSFTEGDIPPPSEVESLYLALALGGHGCCRHRAFAFMATTHALGIPTRVVVNEAHAFIEVMLPGGDWHQINLGGCGSYTINNPNNYREYNPASHDPRGEANPNEGEPRTTVETFTNITESPERIVKGERYTVKGTVQIPGGRPAPGLRIDLFLNETKTAPGRLTGAGVTDARGEFSIVARVPRELAARDYQLVARAQDPGGGAIRYLESWSDPEINVFAPTKFLFPRIGAAAGFPTNITGRLVDVDNNPLPFASVNWTIDGQPRAALRTDPLGRLTSQATFETTGDRVIRFVFGGDEHHGASTIDIPVRVETGAILIPPEAPTLARGETGTLGGSLAIAGQSLGSRAVTATILTNDTLARSIASGNTSTDTEGRFQVPLQIRSTLAPGVYPVRYEIAGLGLNTTGLVRIAIRPTIVVEAPEDIGPSEAWVLRATLRSDNGTALANGIVEIVTDGNRSTSRALLTNRTGVARFEFPAHSLDAGTHSIVVTFPGDAAHADVLARAEIEVVRPWFATVPWWSYAAVAAALAAVALVAWIVRPAGPLRRRLVAARRATPPRRSVEVAFPDHPVGVPPVFEPGEAIALRVHVRHRDGRLVPGWLALDAPDGRQRGRAPAEGWSIALRAPQDGPLTLRIRATGLARLWTAPLALDVPVHSYRRAVEEGFVALRQRARLAPSASPGDLVRALGPRLSSAQQTKLRQAAALFDAADYSERPVDRAFYHAFAVARRDLERSLGGDA